MVYGVIAERGVGKREGWRWRPQPPQQASLERMDDSWVSDISKGQGSEAAGDECSVDSHDSDLLDGVLRENERYRIEAELLRARLAEVELDRAPAKPVQTIAAPSSYRWSTVGVFVCIICSCALVVSHERRETRIAEEAAEMLRRALNNSRAEYDELLVHYSTLKEQHRTCALKQEERSLGLAPARGPLDVLLAAAHVVLRAGRRLLPLDLGLPGFKRPSAVESA